MERAGETVARLHANRSQNQREAALEGFREGKYRVLVATDIAARGLDVELIGHVVIYDLPHVAADYVHRVGRTARMEASGRASTFMSPEEAPLLRDIERLTRSPLPKAEVPRGSEAFKEVMASRAAHAHPPERQRQHHHQKPKPKHHHGPKHHGGGGHATTSAGSGAKVFSGGPRRRR